MNRKLFVMWDDHIRKGYKIRSNNAENYYEFLCKMQKEFGSVEWNNSLKTLAKAIDRSLQKLSIDPKGDGDKFHPNQSHD